MSQLHEELVGDEPYQYYPLGEHVVCAIGVCRGRPTFKYTRIEVAGALERLAAGETISDLVEGYNNRVSEEAIREAIHLAAISFVKGQPELEPVA